MAPKAGSVRANDAGVAAGVTSRRGTACRSQDGGVRLGLVTPWSPSAQGPRPVGRRGGWDDVGHRAGGRPARLTLTCSEHVAIPGRSRGGAAGGTSTRLAACSATSPPRPADPPSPPTSSCSATTTPSGGQSATAPSTSCPGGWSSALGVGSLEESSTCWAPRSPTGVSRPTSPWRPSGLRGAAASDLPRPAPAVRGRRRRPAGTRGGADLGRWAHRALSAPGLALGDGWAPRSSRPRWPTLLAHHGALGRRLRRRPPVPPSTRSSGPGERRPWAGWPTPAPPS